MTVHDAQDQIERTIDLAAPPGRVWRALADRAEFEAWFQVRLDTDFAVGETTTGTMTSPGAKDVAWESVTETMDRERLLAFSWPPSAVDPDTHYDRAARIRVEFRLAPTAFGTRLTIRETGFRNFPESKRREILQSCAEGWELQAGRIKAHVER
ncbi:MAG: SRPBCC family protein [Oceanicaulis sp.]